MLSVEALALRIEAGEAVSTDRIIAALAKGPIKERCAANMRLFDAFKAVGRNEDALGCAERAWFLGHRTGVLADFLVRQLIEAKRPRDALDRLREAVLFAVRNGATQVACNFFVRFQNLAGGLNLPDHDAILVPEIIALVRRPRPSRRSGDALRIGYLMWGEHLENSVLVQALLEIGRHHDRSRFQPLFFSCGARTALLQHNKRFPEWLEAMAEMDAPFIANDEAPDPFTAARTMSDAIAQQHVDALVVLGQYGNNFLVAAMAPAPVVVGLDLGSPHAYSSPALDHVIVPSKPRHMMEELCDATDVRGAYMGFREEESLPVDRSTLGAAHDDVVVMTSGAPDKFRGNDFAGMLADLVRTCAHVRLVLVGPDRNSATGRYFREALAPDLLNRVVLTGYRHDFAALIRAADIYVDTYPVGGGYAMYEALCAGVACVTFGQRLHGLFNKREHYARAEVFCAEAGIVVPGDGIEPIRQRVHALIAQPELRRSLGERGRAAVQPYLDKPSFTREIEQVITRLYSGGAAA